MNKREALEAAITAHAKPDAPGKWSVEVDDGYIFLIWTCDEDALPEMYGDEPWSEWGGNEIVAASGLGSYRESGIDGYTDKYDQHVVSHFVWWELCRNYRIEDKRNVTLNGVKATLFTIYHREPHPLLESAFVYQGAYAGVGHDLTDEECLKAFEETPDDY